MEFHRIEGIMNLPLITQQKILVFGLGSLGSLTVGNLIYPWRSLVLADPDIFEMANVERHLLGKSGNIGKPKVEGVKRWLKDRNVPSRSIVTHFGPAEEILDQHADADLVICCVDKRRVRDVINAWCYEHSIPALYGGIYPYGTGGHIMVVPTPRDACYQCAEYIMGGQIQEVPNVTDYGIDITTLYNEAGDLTAVPALRAPVSCVADDMANFALNLMKGGDVSPQILVRAFNAWETFIHMNEDASFIKMVKPYLESYPDTVLVPHERIVTENGGATLEIRNTARGHVLKRWRGCPLHTQKISLDEI